jgi:hypothetical protein
MGFAIFNLRPIAVALATLTLPQTAGLILASATAVYEDWNRSRPSRGRADAIESVTGRIKTPAVVYRGGLVSTSRFVADHGRIFFLGNHLAPAGRLAGAESLS